ncbi:MAG: hypothetical protein ACOZDD_11890 [Bacteroidota bacterium]
MKKLNILPLLLALLLPVSAATAAIISPEGAPGTTVQSELSGMAPEMDLITAIPVQCLEYSDPDPTELTGNAALALYDKGVHDARERYTEHKTAGVSTLVSSSLMLPIGIVAAVDQSAEKDKGQLSEIADPKFRSDPAYMKGLTTEAQKMKRKSIRKNLLIGIAVQAVVATAVGTTIARSDNARIGMSGF